MAEDTKQNEEPLAQTEVTPAEEEELKAAIEAGDFDIKEFLTQFKEALAAKEEADNRALRVQADFDNFRRRSRKDTEEMGKKAMGELICALLPILDNFERALDHMGESAEKEGICLIYKQLYCVLQNAGLIEIEALAADFDPNLHQAVTQEKTDEEQKGKVLMVLQKGYMYDNKLLRAAMVQVGT
jgi:molecular chaperone GrpE